MMHSMWRPGLWMVLLAGVAAPAISQENRVGCGELANAYGPYDYSDPVHLRDNWPIVEYYHFTREVQNLIRGRSDTIAGDLDYTLRAFPNNYLALDAVARYQLANPRPDPRYYTVECYFDRALRWRPEDARVYMTYAIYLNKKGDTAGARKRYEEALSLDPLDAEINYNAGLFYLAQKDYEKARAHAETAYAAGVQFQGLRNKLVALKVWDGKVSTQQQPVASTP
jgi:tetratricopeptide (TPR) repeat protein